MEAKEEMTIPAQVAMLRCRRVVRSAVKLRRSCFGPCHRLYAELETIERELKEIWSIACLETENAITETQCDHLSRLSGQVRAIRRQVEF